MEAKYYVPKIEEFHVGFEFEYKNKENIWIASNDFSFSFLSDDTDTILEVVRYLEDGKIRVKLLDDDDIYDGSDFCPIIKDNITVFSNAKSELKGPEGNQWIQFTSWTLYKGDKLNFIIERNVEDTRTKKTEQETIFNGIIKNKSELRKLMSQLNI